MSRKWSAGEIKTMLAAMARVEPDDFDGYVIVLSGDNGLVRVTNAADESTEIRVLAAAIDNAAQQILNQAATAQ